MSQRALLSGGKEDLLAKDAWKQNTGQSPSLGSAVCICYFYQHSKQSELMCCVLGHFLMFPVAGGFGMAPVLVAAK